MGIGRNIGSCSVELAKLWVIYYRLSIIWDVQWKDAIFELYCAFAVKRINGGAIRIYTKIWLSGSMNYIVEIEELFLNIFREK